MWSPRSVRLCSRKVNWWSAEAPAKGGGEGAEDAHHEPNGLLEALHHDRVRIAVVALGTPIRACGMPFGSFGSLSLLKASAQWFSAPGMWPNHWST